MKISKKDAVVKLSHYITYLAAKAHKATGALHEKQARANQWIKLSQALHDKQDLTEALKVAYPKSTEQQRTKVAFRLVHGLAVKMRKAASLAMKKKAMGDPMGAGVAGGGAVGGSSMSMGAGGDGGGGGGGARAAGGFNSMIAGGSDQGQGADGIRTAPSYSHSSAVQPAGIAKAF